MTAMPAGATADVLTSDAERDLDADRRRRTLGRVIESCRPILDARTLGGSLGWGVESAALS